MKTISISRQDCELMAPAVIAGMMRIQKMSDLQVRRLFDAALEAGINYFDHADIYGEALHGCEKRFGEALRLTPEERGQILLQSKAGYVRNGPYFDFSYEHITETVNGSLSSPGTDYLDFLLLHRPDALAQPDEVARAFDDLATAGKVSAFGVSNHTPGQIELLQRSVRQPLVINQVQLSITHAPMIAHAVAMNMQGEQQSASRDLGLLDYCRLHGITVQAWSPFQAGFKSTSFLGSLDYPELNALIDDLTKKYDVPPIAIATAWITRHPAQMQVVIGTTNPERVSGAAQGADVMLTRPEWYGLMRAAGYVVP
ncbi:aldo/keto reductase [Rhizobium sp. Leaf386]|uniref:aldo/keto reductase n=1 Tax=Rhizobium sp. Leaf386 TaxID=1736359 RepID=UPI000715C5F8|nr:aldo/keto reductase [Rhizobium sp. Leaf386]KQS84509.1 aldo/keto reductase [Rhizobium sp. Leaf386]